MNQGALWLHRQSYFRQEANTASVGDHNTSTYSLQGFLSMTRYIDRVSQDQGLAVLLVKGLPSNSGSLRIFMKTEC